MSIITYHITADYRGRLRESAKLACSFWNRFVEPKSSIVIRLGTFEAFGSTIARAYRPFSWQSIVYGVVEFNTRHLEAFKVDEIVVTIIHEIGHILGIGSDDWMGLFSHSTGRFYKRFTKKIPELARMIVETDCAPGTTLTHWGEMRYGELMSEDDNEYVLPVTIGIMTLLGHDVIERLTTKRYLADILDELRSVVFTRQEEANQLVRDAFVQTEIWEEIYDTKGYPFRGTDQ